MYPLFSDCGVVGVFGVVDPSAFESVDCLLRRAAGSAEIRVSPISFKGAQAFGVGNIVVVADARLENQATLAEILGVSREMPAPLLIAQAWLRWGAAGVARLDGEFAFALFDLDAGQLVLARDALGRRPLHFSHHGELVVFASTPLPLARFKQHVRADLDRLTAFVAHLPESGPRSFLEGVSRVMPGHLVTVAADGTARQIRWWNPDIKAERLSFDDAVAAVQCEIDLAISNVVEGVPEPLAAQLSGGLDSAIICASAVRLRPAGARLITVTGAPGGPVDGRQSGHFEDEPERAMASANAIGTLEPHLVTAPPQSPLETAMRDSSFAQRPFLNPCNSGWLDATYDKARQLGATVILEGMVGNYSVSWDGFERLGELLKRGRWITLAREIASFRRSGGGSAYGIVRWALTEAWPALGKGDVFHDHFLRPQSARARALVSLVKQQRRPRSSARYRMGLIEYVDPGLIQHGVRVRFGLDQRDPLGARRLVELCLRLPASHFFRRGKTRRIARALLRGAVPDWIVDEPRRGLQGADWRAGAERAIPAMLAVVDAATRDERLVDLFDLPRLRRTIETWPDDGWDNQQQVQIYRRDVVRAVCALQWVAQVDQWSLDDRTSRQ